MNFYDVISNMQPASNKAEVKDLFRSLSREANCFGFPAKENAEKLLADKHASEVMFPIALQWVSFWSQAEDWRKDGRNEIACTKCQEYIANLCTDAPPIEMAMSESDYSGLAKMFVEQSTQEHRTLMQTETSLMFAFLDGYPDASVQVANTKMESEYGQKWYRMPLI